MLWISIHYTSNPLKNLGIRPTTIIHSTQIMQIFVYKSPISTQLLFISTTVLKKSSMKMHRKLHFLCSIIWITCIQTCVHLLLLNILHYTCNFIFFNYFIHNYISSWCSITSETIIKLSLSRDALKIIKIQSVALIHQQNVQI